MSKYVTLPYCVRQKSYLLSSHSNLLFHM